MLFDWLELLFEIKNFGWSSRGAADTDGHPTNWRSSNCSRQANINRITCEIEGTTAQHLPERDGVQITTNDQRHTTLHLRHRRHQSVMLFEPSRLPVGF